ncbi:MAG: caspase family protein [Eubacteriales bacterium]|nr:caspase family protein [Eubacteriales bacterium]
MRQTKPARPAVLWALLLGMLVYIAPLCAAAGQPPAFSTSVLEAYTGETVDLTALLENAQGRQITYASSDEEVVSVDKQGVASILSPGRARVSASAPDGASASLSVRVIDPLPARRALLLSEQRYDDGRTRTGAVNTVQGLSDMLGALRYRSGTPFEVTVQIDSTLPELSEAIRTSLGEAEPEDVSLFYISCHGEMTDGEPCLLLHDGTLVSVRALEAMLRQVPGRIVVLIDCCQSGAFIGSAAAQLYAQSVAKVFSDSALLSGKYLVMTSCGADEESYRISDTGENTESSMSTVFARALCEGLGWDLDNDRSVTLRADANRDGAVTFTELWLYTRRRVYYHLSGTGVSQTVMAWPEINEAVLFARQFS